MSETWYLLRSFSFGRKFIEPVEVEKVTEHFVTIKGRRNARSSSHDSYFPTWQEAKDEQVRRKLASLESARSHLAHAEAEYAAALELTP